MKRIFFLSFMFIFLIVGCSSSPEAIQKAIQQTQTALPTPTVVPIPESRLDKPMFRGNLARTGEYSDSGPKELNELVWKFKVKDDKRQDTSPVVYQNIVLIGSYDSYLYALNAKTGEIIWEFKTDDDVISNVAVEQGIVYFGSDDGFLYAVDVISGQQIWKFETGKKVFSSPAVSW